MQYWLMKSEPGEYSIDDLVADEDQSTYWDGIRNYQARNFMRDGMKTGDQAFFYHSSCKVPGIVGIVEIIREAYPDHTAFDATDKHYDAKSDPENPRWLMVDIKLVHKLKRVISLTELREHGDQLENFRLLARGNRLSLFPVDEQHWQYIVGLE
jgi:predicted RNA-binding protein with PUA-like domain